MTKLLKNIALALALCVAALPAAPQSTSLSNVAKLNSFKVLSDPAYAGGAKCDGSTNDTAAINAALLALADGDTIVVPSGTCMTDGGHSTSKVISIIGHGGSPWLNSVPKFKLRGAATYLLKFNNLTTDTNALKSGAVVKGIVFDGGDFALSDAMVVIEGYALMTFRDVGFHNAVGNGVRARIFWDSVLDRTMFRRIDASGAGKAVFYIDSRYNSNDNLNVNNLRITNSHFEANNGSYFASQSDSNLSIFTITNTKFEYGALGASVGPFTMFDLVQGARVRIYGNAFTNFKTANRYDTIFKPTSCVACSFVSNDFFGLSNTTTVLSNGTGARTTFKGNTSNGSSDQLPLLSNSSLYQLDYEQVLNADSSQAVNSSGQLSNASPTFISVHKIGTNSQLYAVDSGSKNLEGTVFKVATASTLTASVPPRMVDSYGAALRACVRARSETGGGNGALELFANNVSQGVKTIPVAYADTCWNVQYSAMATGILNFRWFTKAGNAENVYLDGIYLIPQTWHYANSAVWDPANIVAGAGATQTVTVTGAALGDVAFCSFSLDQQGMQLTGYVSAGNTVACRLDNNTGGALDLASGTLRAWVMKSQ